MKGSVGCMFREETGLSSPMLRVIRDILKEDPENVGTLTPASSVVVGAGLSVMLWCLITLVIIGVSTFVNSMLAV